MHTVFRQRVSLSKETMMNLRQRVSQLLALIYLLGAYPACADESWRGFRGDGSGITTQTNLPVRWSPEQGVAWKSPIPGYGQSAPVIWKRRIFVTSTEGPFQQNCLVHAFDLNSGQKEWTCEVEATTSVENYFRNSRAAPTCVVDANSVFSFFASGDVTAMTHDGEIIWSVPLLKTLRRSRQRTRYRQFTGTNI